MTQQIECLKVTRADRVQFVYNVHSPNGTVIKYLTAHDDYWASVPVGKFETVTDALLAVEQFVMPER